ncbi:MAG: efflux RND transporter periplasmic adaptor subunit [Gemmataceae bacterium]
MTDDPRPPSVITDRAGAPRNGEPGTLSERVRSLRLPNRMEERARPNWLPWSLCVLFAVTSLYLASRAIGSRDTPAPDRGDAVAVPTGTLPEAKLEGEVVLESKGYIVPLQQIQVSPKVGGMVVRLNFEEGQRVEKGDVLAELETVDYQADVDAAQALLAAAQERLNELQRNHEVEIQQAKAELDEAVAQREQLFLDWKRSSTLQRDNALAVREFEQARFSFQAADRKVERLRLAYMLMKEGPRLDRIKAADADVRQANANLVKAQWRLDNCRVVAPVTGVILTKKAEEGNIVNPIAFNVSASLCEMADLSKLEVDLTIQERDVAKVSKGQRCRIRSDAYPDRVYVGEVSRLMPIADRAKGAIPVRVRVLHVLLPQEEKGQGLEAEQGRYLKPEMGAVVTFLRTDD